jgi:hypothetical protein
VHRRDVLRLGATAVGAAVVGRPTAAHPGPYQPYGTLDLEGAREVVVADGGEVAYVATSTGYAAVDVSAADRPRVLADRRDRLADREDGPLRGVQDVSVSGDRLLVAGPANPLPGALAGVLLVDVSDPAAPRDLAFYETGYPVHNCDLHGGYAYLTNNDHPDHPLVVLGVADDGIRRVARWALEDHDPAWSTVGKRVRSVHDVTVHDDRAYVSLWDAGTWILDVSDPTDPVALGRAGGREWTELADLGDEERRRASLEPPGNHHSAAVSEDGRLLAVSRESWASGGGEDRAPTGGPSGVELWNVADPAAPARLSVIDPPSTDDPTLGGTWTTSHNLDLRGDRLYTSWYQGGVKRHDVADPTDPRELAWWRDPDEARFWTAQLAVPGAAEGFFVASSMGVGDVPARLYTFPDHAGVQVDAPPLGGNESGSGEPELLTPTGTATPTPTPTPTPASSGEGPGFGLAGAAAAVGTGLAWRLWRTRTDDRE